MTMHLKTALLLVFFLIGTLANAQEKKCECGKDFEFLTSRYLHDYSGMQDFRKQNPDYLKKIEKLSKKANSAKSFTKCNKIIETLIKYLDNRHVNAGPTEDNPLYVKKSKKNENHRDSLDPKIKFLDEKTVLIGIKTADLSFKPMLDSLVLINKERLDTTRHFIIDLRGNGGGGDATFNMLIPYLYTNPILIHLVELWSTENNIKVFENFLDNPHVPAESKEFIKKIVSKGKQNINKFVPISEQRIDTLQLDGPKSFPEKVSIIIDKKCFSATEQFLLLAKQSSKVTIYGYENSGGALDYSNLNVIVTPSGYWYASVPTTRTTRLPDNPVDPDGIRPHVLVDKKIKDIIKFVQQL